VFGGFKGFVQGIESAGVEVPDKHIEKPGIPSSTLNRSLRFLSPSFVIKVVSVLIRLNPSVR